MVIAQSEANLPQAIAQAAIEIDEPVVAPDRLRQVVPSNQVARSLKQHPQHQSRLSLERHTLSVLEQFNRGGVKLESVEANHVGSQSHLTQNSSAVDW
jgi:hypothetical protein